MYTNYPLTTLFINGHEVYPMLIADFLTSGITTEWSEVQSVLTHLTILQQV